MVAVADAPVLDAADLVDENVAGHDGCDVDGGEPAVALERAASGGLLLPAESNEQCKGEGCRLKGAVSQLGGEPARGHAGGAALEVLVEVLVGLGDGLDAVLVEGLGEHVLVTGVVDAARVRGVAEGGPVGEAAAAVAHRERELVDHFVGHLVGLDS